MRNTPHHIALLFLSVLASACSTPKQTVKMPEGPYIEVKQEIPLVKTRVVPVPYAQPVPGQARPLPRKLPSDAEVKAALASKRPAKEVIEEANRAARTEPTREGYFNAIQTYNYMPGALYQVYSAPNHLTMISFARGEKILSRAAGDTTRWLVERTISGEGATRQEHLLVQPVLRGLHTTMIVTTTTGTYTFELKSYQHTFMAGVRFRYPRAVVQRLARASAASHKKAVRKRDASGLKLAVSLDALEERYRLVVSDTKAPPRWMPRRVFHDGQRTYIEFPREPGNTQRPALYILDRTKQPRLVQYAVRGRFYVVTEVIHFAMLRLGKHHSQQIGIELSKEAR